MGSKGPGTEERAARSTRAGVGQESGGIPRGAPTLRGWQREAVATWEAMGAPRDFLAEATPGAGKTTFALALVLRGAREGAGARDTVAVVCPTTHLRAQWQAAAHRAGLELCTDLPGPTLPRGFGGAALTYAQVLSDPARYRRALGAGWVILDECHHAGEGRSWVDALEQAFGGARHRLSLSGTAFRSDDCRIPFVRYTEDGLSQAEYRYGYGRALADGVVRPVYFVSFGGEAEWYRKGRVRRASFGEALPGDEAAARLRTVLDPGGGWLRQVLERAHRRLDEVRRDGHPDAGALAVCRDQEHARSVAALLRRIMGCAPALALSDDPASSAVISRFAAGREPWIVAVRQVSEGTDIPRLRVGAWATNASTELFFRQVAGRLVRVVPGLGEQRAYLYLPADPVLLGHACALAAERAHHLAEGSSLADVAGASAAGGVGSDYQALDSFASEGEILSSGGGPDLESDDLSRDPMVTSDEVCDGVSVLTRRRTGSSRAPEAEDVPLEARVRRLRSLLARRVSEYCALTGVTHQDAYARLRQRAGRSASSLGETWLVRHVRTVEGWSAARLR